MSEFHDMDRDEPEDDDGIYFLKPGEGFKGLWERVEGDEYRDALRKAWDANTQGWRISAGHDTKAALVPMPVMYHDPYPDESE